MNQTPVLVHDEEPCQDVVEIVNMVRVQRDMKMTEEVCSSWAKILSLI